MDPVIPASDFAAAAAPRAGRGSDELDWTAAVDRIAKVNSILAAEACPKSRRNGKMAYNVGRARKL